MKKVVVNLLVALIAIAVMIGPGLMMPSTVSADTITLWPDGDTSDIYLTEEGDGDDHYAHVNENPDDESTYVWDYSLSGNYDFYTLENPSLSGTINSVTVYMKCQAQGFTNQESACAGIRIGDSGTVVWGTCVQLEYNNWVIYNSTIARPGGGNWSWTDINDLQVGVFLADASYSISMVPSCCSQIYVVVDYTPPTTPTVTTDAATNVEETTATLNGTITDDGGEACQYRFEYDTDSGEPYAYNTSWTGNRTSGQSFSEAISSLDKGTKYYFRAQGKNSVGTASGSEQSFLSKPDAPTGFNATVAGSNQIDLSWAKGDGAQKTKIQRKEGDYPTNRDDGTQVYFDTGIGTSDTGLNASTTYYYRAWSYVEGSEQWSDDYAEAWATTTGPCILSEDFDSYTLGTTLQDMGGGWVEYFGGAGSAQQYVDNTNYVSAPQSLHLAGLDYYSVRAYHAVSFPSQFNYEAMIFNNSYGAAILELLDPDADTWGKTYGMIWFYGDGNIYAWQKADGTANVLLMPYSPQTWYHVKVYMDLTTRTFDVYIDGILRGSNLQIMDAGTPTGISLCTIGIAWYDDVEVCSPLTLPTVITDAATNVEETTATLSGNITDDGGEACEYRFEYDTDSGEPYAYNTSWTGNRTSGQSFSEAISSLSKGTKYYFRAQGKNSVGTASGSEQSFLTKPDAPNGFNATVGNSTQIDLSWAKGDGAQKTKIQRKEGSYPTDRDDGTQVYFDTGTGTSDTGLNASTTYYYRAWSYAEGSEQWSDDYAEGWATTSGTVQLSGVTTQVDCSALAGVTVTVYDGAEEKGSTTSDGSGNYTLSSSISETGTYTVIASKAGFRDESQSIDVLDLEQQYELNFRGETGLVPNSATVFYVLECVNHWLYPEAPCELTVFRVLDVVNAWLYPV